MQQNNKQRQTRNKIITSLINKTINWHNKNLIHIRTKLNSLFH